MIRKVCCKGNGFLSFSQIFGHDSFCAPVPRVATGGKSYRARNMRTRVSDFLVAPRLRISKLRKQNKLLSFGCTEVQFGCTEVQFGCTERYLTATGLQIQPSPLRPAFFHERPPHEKMEAAFFHERPAFFHERPAFFCPRPWDVFGRPAFFCPRPWDVFERPAFSAKQLVLPHHPSSPFTNYSPSTLHLPPSTLHQKRSPVQPKNHSRAYVARAYRPSSFTPLK